MSDSSKSTSGGDPNPSGNADGNPPEPKNDAEALKAKNDELLKEKRAMQRKLEAIEAEKRAAEEKALKDKEDYKTLAEQRAADLEAAKQKLSAMENEQREQAKLAAVLGALGGARPDPKYWGLIDLSKVAIDPDTGSVDKTSAAKVADLFKQEHPILVQPKKGDGFDKSAPEGSGQKLTHEEWLKLPAKEMAKRLPDVWGR